MGIFYLIPAAILWVIYGLTWWFNAPWWVDYPTFALAVASTAVGGMIAALSNVGPRF